MSYLSRSSAFLRKSVLRTPQNALPAVQKRFATQDYGSGDGSPVGENPQKQGANPSADKEHPGPPPPKTGQGSGGGPTKGTAEGHTKAKQQTGSTSQRREYSTKSTIRHFSSGRLLQKESKPKSTEGLKPKILNESPPRPDEQNEDVRKHNEEMDKRHEKAHESVSNEDAEKDKVGNKFWKGKSA